MGLLIVYTKSDLSKQRAMFPLIPLTVRSEFDVICSHGQLAQELVFHISAQHVIRQTEKWTEGCFNKVIRNS